MRAGVCLAGLAILSTDLAMAEIDERGSPPLGGLVDDFLVFTACVASVIILVLNHLLARSRGPRLSSPDRLFEVIERGLGDEPDDERLLEIAGICLDNAIFDRALDYLDRLGSPGGSPRSIFYRILGLLGVGRLKEAEALHASTPRDTFTEPEWNHLHKAFREHGRVARIQRWVTGLFLTDIHLRHPPETRLDIDRGRGLPARLAHIGDRLPTRYENLEYIGGSRGEHRLRAFDRDLNRRVRLCVMAPERVNDEAVKAFVSRARRQGQVEHPAVARVYDIHRDSLPCYAIEEIDGDPVDSAERIPYADPVGAATILVRVWTLLNDLVTGELEREGETSPFPDLEDLVMDSQGQVRIQELRLPPTIDTSMSGTFRIGSGRAPVRMLDLLERLETRLPRDEQGMEAGRGRHAFLQLMRDQVREVLRSKGDVVERIRGLEGPMGHILHFLYLGQGQRESQDLIRNLQWIDELHRSRIHSLKSKFGVCERYRDDVDKLLRTFFRESNIEEVRHLLESVHRMRSELGHLPAIPEVASVKGMVEGLPLEEMLEVVATPPEGSSPEERQRIVALLQKHCAAFRELSRSMAILIEGYEVDLVRLVESVAMRSPYAKGISVRPTSVGGRIRVPRPREFAHEFSTALENLITNSFEAGSSTLEVGVLPAIGNPYYRVVLTDDGEGTPDDILERIRRERFSTKEGGTSTGVSYAMEIMEKYSGALEFGQRTDSVGTVVTLHLPDPRA